jgi:hypothetical protein
MPGNKTASFELSVTEMDELRSKLTALVTRGLVEYTVAPNNVSGDDDLEFATIDYVNDNGGGGGPGTSGDELVGSDFDAGTELTGAGGDVTIDGGDVTGSNDEGRYTGGQVLIKGGFAEDHSTSEFTFLAEAHGGDIYIEGGDATSDQSNASGGDVYIRGGNIAGTGYGGVYLDGSIRIGTTQGTISSGRTITAPYQGTPWNHNGTFTRKVNVRTINGTGSSVATASITDQILAINTALGFAHFRIFPDGYLYEPMIFKKVTSDTNPIFFSTVTGAAARINGVLCRANVDPPFQLPGSDATNFPSWMLFTDGTNHWIVQHTYPV